jgi:hypothetical protein
VARYATFLYTIPMELLARLLGGQDRVKIMRLFLHHGDMIFSLREVSDKTKTKGFFVRRELAALLGIGFLEKKKTKVYTTSKKRPKVKEIAGFKLNEQFPHNQALKELLFDFELLDKRELANRFKSVGRTKLFIVSGVFIGEKNSRADILLVGEAIKKPKAEKIFDTISAELGREIMYSIMDVEEYEYRFKMHDKFVREIVDGPHELVIDKITEKLKL